MTPNRLIQEEWLGGETQGDTSSNGFEQVDVNNNQVATISKLELPENERSDEDPRMIETTAGREFPLREAHNLVRDLMTPNPWIYWIDFLFHNSLGWAAFIIVLSTPLFSAWQVVAASLCYTCFLPRSYFHP